MAECGEVHGPTGRRCVKPSGHWRLVGRRAFHQVEIPHVGRMRETYRATHVIIWKTRRG